MTSGQTSTMMPAFLNIAQDPIYLVDPKTGQVVDCSPSACRISGFERQALLKKSCADLLMEVADVHRPVDNDSTQAPPELDTQIRATEKTDPRAQEEPALPVEALHRSNDGRTFPVEVRIGRLALEDRDPLAVVYCRDLSEREAMEGQLRQIDQMANLGLLAASVAHEVNNALTYMLTDLDYLVNELPEEPEDLRGIARGVMDGAQRVRKIVRDFKSYSHSHEAVAATPVDVNAVLDVALRMAATELRHRSGVKKELGKLPPVMADEDRLTQVFLNMIVNASQAMAEKSPVESLITLRTWVAHGCVQVEISDTGSGISADAMEHLFEPFFTTKPKGSGTGLGLPICRDIIESYDGTISVSSTEGRGATFTITLPASARKDVEDESARSKSAPTARPVSHQDGANVRKRVLVIDDEVAIGGALKRGLGSLHEVVVATSGEEALNIIRDDDAFDIVLCDIMMPNVTGMDVYETLSKENPPVRDRMIFMTGGAFTERAKSFVQGKRSFAKPFDINEVKTLIRDSEGGDAPALRRINKT